jgi:hypothetical protein
MRLNTLGRRLLGRGGSRRPARHDPGLDLVTLEVRTLPSVAIVVNYSYDVDNFFSTQAKRDLMQQAANTLAAVLNDNLSAITPAGSNTWSAVFNDPSTGASRSIPNLVVPANTLILYVGGGHLTGSSEAGLGSTGGFNVSGNLNWLNTVEARGQAGALATPPTDFGPWGGSISFDDSGSTNWYFGQALAGIGPGQTDFLSVAEHEVGHVLGLGTAPSWLDKVSGGAFHGANAEAAFGGPVPLSPDQAHWAQGTRSDGNNALMDPVLITGTRVAPTTLDFAGLRDVGWQVVQASPPPVVQFSAASYVATEGGPAAVITVTRTGGGGAFAVNYTTGDGTARARVDYLPAVGTLVFGAGDTSKTFTVPILNDGTADGPETVNLTLGSPSAGAILGGPSTAVLTISDPALAYRAPADFDPDGRTDLGVYRPVSAQWFINRSTAGPIVPYPTLGTPKFGDIPVVGDFDGIGRAEIGFFRPSTAQWFVQGPGGLHLLGTFGAPGLFDIPVPGDYDGVGHAELAVFRPSTAQWIVLGPKGGHLLTTFGATNLSDIPVPGDYDGIGRTEPAVFRPSTAQWFVLGPSGGRRLGTFGAPNLSDVPAPGDYDKVGHVEMAVYRPATAQWFAMGPSGSHLLGVSGDPTHGDLAIEAPFGSLVRLGVANRSAALAASRPTAAGAAPGFTSQSPPVTAPLAVEPLAPPAPPTPASAARHRATALEAWLSALERLDAELR